MLTTPIFRPWRPLWDAHLSDVTPKLDELARQRQKGRQVPPPVRVAIPLVPGDEWKAGHRKPAAQLMLILANLSGFEAMMERQAASMVIGYRLDILRSEPNQLGESIKAMRILVGQKLKHGRDILGAGTESDPYRFRDKLCYHDAYNHYLAQENIQVRNCRVEQLNAAFGDRVETEDGRVLYFLNDQIAVQ